MEVILDSNFIVSCVMKGIDFISQLEGKGFKILIPREVIQEIKDLRNKVPILTDGDKIVWVVGYRIANDVKITEKTNRVLKLRVSKM